MKNQTIFVNVEDLLSDTPDIIIKNEYSKLEKKIPILFSMYLLHNKEIKEELSRVMSGELEFLVIRIKKNGHLEKSFCLSRIEIIKYFNSIIDNDILFFNKKEKEIISNMKEQCSYYHSFDLFPEDVYEVKIDNNDYQLSYTESLALLKLPPNLFEEYFFNYDEIMKEKKGNYVPKEHLLWALRNLIKSYNLLDNYDFDPIIAHNYHNIINFKFVDFESINFLTKIEDINQDKLVVSEELKNEVFAAIPNNLSILEKSIFIYCKLCELLSYDEYFYVNNHNGKKAEKHIGIDNISLITPYNNSAVCYEFSAIYGWFLKQLGICYTPQTMDQKEYENTHTFILYRFEKFLIKADGLSSVFDNDAYNVKVKNKLEGISCVNENDNTKNEFNEIKEKVLGLIYDSSKEDIPLTRNELIADYCSLTNNKKPISLEEKTETFFTILKSYEKHFSNVEAIAFLKQIKKEVFGKQSSKNTVQITFLKNNSLEEEGRLTTIISINERGVNNDIYNNLYYVYVPSQDIELLTYNELQSRFNKNYYEYIDERNHVVPGIKSRRVL